MINHSVEPLAELKIAISNYARPLQTPEEPFEVFGSSVDHADTSVNMHGPKYAIIHQVSIEG